MVWVDPLVGKFPNIGGYVYCAANPIRYVGPTGESFGDFMKGLWTGTKNGAVGTWDFFTEDMWKGETWSAMWDLGVAVVTSEGPHDHPITLAVLIKTVELMSGDDE